ncbi:MAG: cytochrome c-type biogenesis protein [Luteimonas sp.]
MTAALLLSLALIAAPGVSFAQTVVDATPLQFASPAEEQRFHALVSELRCVMCQNQSLADSNAQIANDLRREVLQLMHESKSDAEIKQFLVARYGEFVLYKPRVEATTWLLWFGPALLLCGGGVLIARIVRRRGARGAVAGDDGQEW